METWQVLGRAWVERLQHNAAGCLGAVDAATYRTWLLYLAGAAASFEEGLTGVSQLLLGRRDSPRRRLTREYICRKSVMGEAVPGVVKR